MMRHRVLSAGLITACLLAGCAARPTPPASVAPASADTSGGGRIVNGKEAAYGTAPWQVDLTYSDGATLWRCGGVLIRADWVLTARHCVQPKGASFDEATAVAAITVSAGHLFIGDRPPADDAPLRQTRPIDQAKVAPGWRVLARNFKAGDMALLHLAKPFSLNQRTPTGERSPRVIALPPADTAFPLQGPGQISGWGATAWSVGSSDAPPSVQLLYADVDILPAAACPAQTGLPAPFPPALICAWKARGDRAEANSTTCSGDSGGPLVLQGSPPVLVGLVSGAIGCGPKAAVFTRVSAYVAWINATIGVAK